MVPILSPCTLGDLLNTKDLREEEEDMETSPLEDMVGSTDSLLMEAMLVTPPQGMAMVVTVLAALVWVPPTLPLSPPTRPTAPMVLQSPRPAMGEYNIHPNLHRYRRFRRQELPEHRLVVTNHSSIRHPTKRLTHVTRGSLLIFCHVSLRDCQSNQRALDKSHSSNANSTF